MLRTAICLSAAILVAQSARAQSIPAMSGDGAAVVADIASKAIARGYGRTCSLTMEPVRTGGYYPCLDFGPYRIVKEYGRIRGFVVHEGSPPFQVLSYGDRGDGFVEGPWVIDMPARIVSFWSDVVDGGLDRAKRSNDARTQRQAAEDYVRKLTMPLEAETRPSPAGPPAEAKGSAPADAGGGVMDALTADRRRE